MTDIESALIQMQTTQLGLRMIITTMISRAARQHDNPEQYVMTLLGPLLSGAEDFDTNDPVGQIAAQTMLDLHNQIENGALDLLQP